MCPDVKWDFLVHGNTFDWMSFTLLPVTVWVPPMTVESRFTG